MLSRIYLHIFAYLKLWYFICGLSYRGSYLTWKINQTDNGYYPSNVSSSNVKVLIQFTISWMPSTLSDPCINTNQGETCRPEQTESISIYYGRSEFSQPHFHRVLTSNLSCNTRNTVHGHFIAYSDFEVVLPKRFYYKIRHKGCCWSSDLQQYPSSTWNTETLISFRKRQNSLLLNSAPQLRYLPHEVIAHSHVTITSIKLPVFDENKDVIRCRWATNFTEGGGVYFSKLGTLFENNCSLDVNARLYYPGLYTIAVMVEDFLSNDHEKPSSSVPLQFAVRIIASNELPGKYASTKCSYKTRNPLTLIPMVERSIPTERTSTIVQNNNTDACKDYKVLEEKDRTVTFSDLSAYRCDMQLSGWYKFAGMAGNQMLTSCPIGMSKKLNRCGSYYQGWLHLQSKPKPTDGEMLGEVCFSPPHSCQCSHYKRIKLRNCGEYMVYFFDGVPRCNSRYCGKKELGTTVHCSLNYMKIDLDRSHYNHTLYSSITLRSTACEALLTPTHISLGTTLAGCRSSARHVNGFIIYENDVILKAKTFGIITRTSDQTIRFSCIYPSNSIISLGTNLVDEVNATEPGFGNFELKLNLHNNHKYQQSYKIFPVSVQLTDKLYFEATTTAQNTFVLLIDQCFSTPTVDQNHIDKNLFISERCGIGRLVNFHNTTRSKQRFSIKAADLLKNNTQAYVHCLLFLCLHTSTEDQCTIGCNGNNLKRTVRSVQSNSFIFRPSTVSKLYLVQLGAIKKEPDQAGGDLTSRNRAELLIGLILLPIVLHFYR